MISASRIVEVRQSTDGQRFRLYVEIDGVSEAIEMPVHDLLRMLPSLNSLSLKPNGVGRALLTLADHGTAILPEGELVLSFQTQEGWAASYQVGATELASLRSSLASAATAIETMKSRN